LRTLCALIDDMLCERSEQREARRSFVAQSGMKPAAFIVRARRSITPASGAFEVRAAHYDMVHGERADPLARRCPPPRAARMGTQFDLNYFCERS
jgi:hypothetical protein